MSLPKDPAQPPRPTPESHSVPRARRRRARRTYFPKDAAGRAEILSALARRAYPSYELFIYSLLSGAVLGLGYIFDSNSVLVLGVLFAPLMVSWVGLTLATISGTSRLFFQTLMGLFISALLVFLTGALAGLASRVFQPLILNQAFNHSRLWIPDLVVLAFGAILLTISFVRSEDKPYLPSALVAYGLFLPLSAGGFGLGSGVGELWPNGLLVFFVNLTWATLLGLLTLAILRFRPLTAGGYGFGLTIFAITLVTLVFLTRSGGTSPASPEAAAPLPTASSTASEFVPLPTSTFGPIQTSTPVLLQPTETESNAGTISGSETVTPVPLTLEVVLPPTETVTPVPSLEATPVLAMIRASEGGGAFVRDEPRGKVLLTLDNGSFVEILPETQENSGVIWVHVRVQRGGLEYTGWVIQSVLEMSTPVPDWEPTATPTETTTP